ncbi:hypothetical protein [Litoribacter populi]|uniref:hypothetical protein n=1 Tax=Litoribacter populi TaxID=2598460 RepID=UPI00117C13BC|nr:hypothetical protein [Litoribacter populi]
MKLIKTYIIYTLISLFALNSAKAQQTKEKPFEDLAETLKIMTNQELYFAGDKVWFGLKLLKNHRSHKFSKLSYVEIYNPDNDLIHREMLLLDNKEMAYGDFILPDNLEDGEYKIFAYTQWMTNFPSYKIPAKSILVTQMGQENTTGEGQLYYSTKDGETPELTLFHTFDEPLIIEVEELDGTGKLVLEEIPPFEKVDSKVIFENQKRIRYGQNREVITPNLINFHSSNYTLKLPANSSEISHIVIHTDVLIIDTLYKSDAVNRVITLNRENHNRYPEIQISVFGKENQLLTHQYHHQNTSSNLQVSVNRNVKVGNESSAILRDEQAMFGHAFAWVKNPEVPEIEMLATVLNSPSWKAVGESSKHNQNYLLARKEIEKNTNPDKQKDFLPLLTYNPLKSNLKSLRPDLFKSNKSINLPNIEDIETFEVKRRVFHEHFEYDTRVSIPVSPYSVDNSYWVPDYEGYRDLTTFLKEVVPQIRIRKDSEDKTEIRIFNPNMDRVHFKNTPLLLIDFHKIDDPDFLLNYDYAQIDRIEVIYLRNSIDETNLGGKAENGVLALFTKQNDYKIKHNPDPSKYILRELDVPRIPAGNVFHQEANSAVTLSKPQSWNPSIRLTRGRSRINFQTLEEPGRLQVEAFFFNNANWGSTKNELRVN